MPPDDDDALRSRVRGLLAEVSPPATVRRLMDGPLGYDVDAWLRMADDHELQGLHLPVEVGGSGLGWVQQAVVLEEAGRALLCAPYLATVTAAPFLPPELQAAVAGGLCFATFAVAEPASGRWDAAGVQARAVRSPARGWRLEGEKSYVVDGCAADLLVVAARMEGAAGDVGLFLVDAGAPGLDRAPLDTVDQTRRQARITLAATPARPLPGTLSTLMDVAAVALAAEQVGGAARALELALDHAGRRAQFGRPIGSFQAIKHLCAELLLDLECARAAASHAAAVAAAGPPADLPAAAAVAKVAASDAYVRVATEALHLHGGLGFTWDHDAHLYFRRARSSWLLFGDPDAHRERLAGLLGL